MIDKSQAIKHYSRKEIQEEMLKSAKGREVTVRYGDKFGKRPDILKYPADLMEHVNSDASSFHVSVERWKNPMSLGTGMKISELDKLRTGWDLLFDIDIPDMDISKILAHLIIKALRDHGIKSISIKFSGNKGFHIGVPFEAFPKEITITTKEGVEKKRTEYFFPDGLKKISEYLMDYISKNYINITEESIFFDGIPISIDKIKEIFPDDDFVKSYCTKCKKVFSDPNHGKKIEFICVKCGDTEVVDYNLQLWNDGKVCSRCKVPMNKNDFSVKEKCQHNIQTIFDLSLILEVDRQIFSSRHMYRMVYSMHEKSGLVSIPFNPDKVLKFEKKYAKVENLKISKHRFMDTENADHSEGKDLLRKAIDHKIEERVSLKDNKPEKKFTDIDLNFTEKVPKELFPPCIIKGLEGITDGRKRFLFSLKNFLINCNYPFDEIEEIIKEWNSKNQEQLKENLIIGQIRYSKQRNERIMPPNCFYSKDKKGSGHYAELGLCSPDEFCKRIKNPFQYAKFKAKLLHEQEDKKKPSTEKKVPQEKPQPI